MQAYAPTTDLSLDEHTNKHGNLFASLLNSTDPALVPCHTNPRMAQVDVCGRTCLHDHAFLCV